ncbi:DUF4883 family protein [Clostridium sp. HCS.1]|uniref:DUF4883 family protein n=1 Tax=Clostridium sp. HCS.1 TaxID=3238594 RepID=UPI003A100F71
MKKLLSFILVIIFTYLFTSCTFNESQYIRPSSKPKADYYTSEIKDKVDKNEEYTIKIFDVNLYKYYEVDKKEHSIIPEFIDSVKKDNYNAQLQDGLIADYKIIIEFSNSKYVINAFNDKLISIHPWDGVYKEDIISMDDIPDYYNLYKYCEYIKKVASGFEG